MPNDQFVQIPPASTGQKIDTSELLVSGNTVERQRMVVADDSVATGIAPVTAANGLLVDVSRVAGNVAVTNANLDVALSTRLKPADTLTGLTTLGTITNVVHVDDNAGSLTIDSANLDVALSTRLKPADTLAGVTTVGAVTAITNALPTGTNVIGKVGIDQTTPGTTNGVQVNAALPAGTNVIGHVITDTGSTTAVTGTVSVQGSVASGIADSVNPFTIAANDSTGLVDTLDCEMRDGQTNLLTADVTIMRLLEQMLQEQRIGNMLLLKLSEPYSSSGWPSITDPKAGVIQ